MSNPFTEEWLAERMAQLKQPPSGVVVQEAPDVAEALIEAECTKILEEDGWRALRTDPVSDRSRGKGFGELGMADHLYIRYERTCQSHPDRIEAMRRRVPCGFPAAQVMWIEFKKPGEKAKKHQTEWHIKERARGALVLVAGEDFPATIEGFKAWYSKSGLRRAGSAEGESR